MSLRLRQPEPERGGPGIGAASRGSSAAEQGTTSASSGSFAPPPPPQLPPDDIDRWLATFSALARLPEARRAAVADELEDHLRCRTRDLMLRGISESEAARTSIAELGEAAELAARFRLAARTPIWRHVMTFSVIGLSAAALTLSVIAIAGGPSQEGRASQPTGVVFRSPAAGAGTTSASLDDVRLRLDLKDEPISAFFTRAGEAANAPVFAHWGELPVEAEEKITLQVGEVSFPTALRLLNMRLGYGEWAIDYRLRDGVLEFADRNYFDRQEAQLVRYDLAPLAVRATADEIADLIVALVDPESWETNGGTTASYQLAGDQLFINAPQRMLPKVEWVLAQFREQEAAAAADGDAISVRIFPLKEADAGVLGRALEHVVADLPGVRITTDPRTNALIVSATATWHDRIASLLPLLDRPAASARPAPDAAAAPAVSATGPQASVAKLRRIGAIVQSAAGRLGRFPFAPDDVLGVEAALDDFTDPEGQPYWLDIPAMESMDAQRITGYDRSAFTRGDYTATLFADGHAELLHPHRLHQLAAASPNDGYFLDLPEQTGAIAPAKTQQGYVDASLSKLRGIPQLVNSAAHKLGRFPQGPDEVLGLVATVNQFSAPDGQRYWLDIPALDTFDSHRIAGYDVGALARGEYVATLFADGRAEALAPLRFRQLTEQPPNADTDFDLPEQDLRGAADTTPTPIRITADPAGQVLCRWTDADGQEHTLRTGALSFHTDAATFEGAAEFHPGS